MSEIGELREEVGKTRQELLSLVLKLRELDLQAKQLVHDQNSLRAAVTLSLDHLDAIDARLRKA